MASRVITFVVVISIILIDDNNAEIHDDNEDGGIDAPDSHDDSDDSITMGAGRLRGSVEGCGKWMNVYKKPFIISTQPASSSRQPASIS